MSTSDRARTYSRTKDRLALFGSALSILASSGFVFSGLAEKLNDRLLPPAKVTPAAWQRLRYSAALSVLSTLSSLPLRYVGDYTIEHQYDLSKQSRVGWAVDVAKESAIGLPLEIGVIEGLYAAMRRWPREWWLVCAGAVVPLTAVMAQLFPVLIAPRFNTYEPLRDANLAERLTDLTARAGVKVADVMQMDMSRRTSKANAFFTGIGRTKRIVLADTMLDTFTPEEIEGVVAHETAHQVHGDIWRFVALSGIATLVTAKVVDTATRALLKRLPYLAGTKDITNIRSLPVLGVVLSITGVVLGPLQFAYSRRIERKADRYAIRLTGNPSAYAAAMRKLADQNLADPNPPRPIVLLLHSHPPLAERIGAAQAAEFNLVEGIPWRDGIS
jgi:STE24 endopeptidase